MQAQLHPTQSLSEAYQLARAQPIQTEDTIQNFDASQFLQEGNPSSMQQDASRDGYTDHQWDKNPYEATTQEINAKRLRDSKDFEEYCKKLSKNFFNLRRALLKRQGGRIINVYY